MPEAEDEPYPAHITLVQQVLHPITRVPGWRTSCSCGERFPFRDSWQEAWGDRGAHKKAEGVPL